MLGSMLGRTHNPHLKYWVITQLTRVRKHATFFEMKKYDSKTMLNYIRFLSITLQIMRPHAENLTSTISQK